MHNDRRILANRQTFDGAPSHEPHGSCLGVFVAHPLPVRLDRPVEERGFPVTRLAHRLIHSDGARDGECTR